MSREPVLLRIPRLYAILDADQLARRSFPVREAALALREAGVRWVQYRDKVAPDPEVAAQVQMLRTLFPPGEGVLLLNDRVAVAVEAGADGAHIGQQDMDPAEARRVLGEDRILGVSTHNLEQLRAALETGAADYLAIGPVYPTASKPDPDPVVGLAGVAAARSLTRQPLVAIGGITPGRAAEVIAAGADAVAVISALLPPAGQPARRESVAETVRDFLAHLR